jgi:hypothetical protein
VEQKQTEEGRNENLKADLQDILVEMEEGENVKEEEEGKSIGDQISSVPSRNTTIKGKKRTFNITVGGKKSPKKKTKIVKTIKKVNEDNTKVLDLLFSFIGVQGDEAQDIQNYQRENLNLVYGQDIS